MPHDSIVARVGAYYTEALRCFGPSPRGVDWNSTESQQLRFSQLLKIIDSSTDFCLLDYGCGYGALASYLARTCTRYRYIGLDISLPMIEAARSNFPNDDRCSFVTNPSDLHGVDYTVASGIFNVRLDFTDDEWLSYVLATLEEFAGLSACGFAFNMLTAHADKGRMRNDLYYGDPAFFFEHCLRFSRFVSLLHDYGLYEFTILVRFPER